MTNSHNQVRIDHSTGVLYCCCGNDGGGYGSGFDCCSLAGQTVEPTEADWPEPLYLCLDCGNVINWDTLEIVNKV